MSKFPAVFNLTSLNGNNGFAINGINRGDSSGISVSGVGDVNGDGIADIIIGAYGANNNVGQSYVIFGSENGFNTPFDLADLSGTNGFVIDGINNGGSSGWSVSGAGDVNDDGIADIIIGAVNANNNAGQSYVIFGNKSGFTSPFNVTNLDGTNGFVVNGINNGDLSGVSVSGAGDVNGDGVADIIIGAPSDFPHTGQSYVVFGSKSGFNTPFNLADLNGNNGFAINGIKGGDNSGQSVSGAGDVNSDGIADIIIYASYANNNAGQSYVVFGSNNGFTTPFNLADLNGNNGFAINGINGGSGVYPVGSVVSGVGDVNGDSIADIIIYELWDEQSYVVFGSNNGFTTPFNLADLNGANGFAISGIYSGGFVVSVSGAGDVNSDGIADVIIGDMNAGQSYVIFGSNSGFTSPFNLTNLDGNNGFVINAVNINSGIGSSVSGAGDVNNDGITDIVIGASAAHNSTGQSYVIFGSKSEFTEPFNPTDLSGVNGTEADESGFGM